MLFHLGSTKCLALDRVLRVGLPKGDIIDIITRTRMYNQVEFYIVGVQFTFVTYECVCSI